MYSTELWSRYADERMTDLQRRAQTDLFASPRTWLTQLGHRLGARRERTPRLQHRTNRQ